MLARRRRAMPARRPPNRGDRNVFRPVPSPVGGWNERDALDDMKPDEAVELRNLFPGQGSVELRRGYSSHATGLGGAVETVGEFNAGATRRMFAAANGNIWNTTSAGAGTSLASGFSNDRWQWAQFDDASGGARVGLVNGEDAPQIHSGTAVSAMTISGSGLTVANLDGIHIHKSRSYFWDSATQEFWYSGVNALGGSLTKFPLGRVSGTGGNLTAMGTWTKDGGDGQDDLACFFLSSGEVLIYAGDNPGDAAAWALVGRFTLGAPMGVRAIQKIGADLVVSTVDGYQALSLVLSGGRAQQKVGALSDKIRKAVLFATKNYADNFGWQTILYPVGNMAFFNVPKGTSNFEQHVVNTLTGAWCKFTGLNARSFGMFNDRLYFGGSSVVYKADDGRSDAGAAIQAIGQTAWNYLGAQATKKLFKGVRHILKVDGSLSYSSGVGVDFGVIDMEVTESSPVASASPWDTSPWDTSPWSDEFAVNAEWAGAEGDGYNVSARLGITTSTRTVEWLSTQYLYEPGRGSF